MSPQALRRLTTLCSIRRTGGCAFGRTFLFSGWSCSACSSEGLNRVTLTTTEAPPAAEVLRRCAAEVDGPLRAALAQLPAPLCVSGGFHFGHRDADGNHIVAPQGKMVRPAFTCTAARIVNGGDANDLAVRAAVAVELVHNFSLVHDDVMDTDRLRRGRPTIWAQFGVPHAILLGDAMLALASRVLTQEGEAVAAALNAELSTVVVDLCLGQLQDMGFEERLLVSPSDYLEMAAGKTASLLSAACVIGAMAGGASLGQVAVLRRFGHHIGLAFQLVDDVLGIFGDPTVTGKPVGSDLARYKKSMPVLAAMGSGSAAGDQLTELYRTQAITRGRLSHAADLVEQAGGKEWTEREAARQYGLAVDCLDEIGGHAGSVAELSALANLMINRNR